jgi:hypothetical protein
MSVLVRPQIRRPPVTLEVAPRPATTEAAPVWSHLNRWFLILGIPFVVGASFFALAIGLGAEWPMAPAFLLGPLAMISGYIYLSLTSDSNSTDA